MAPHTVSSQPSACLCCEAGIAGGAGGREGGRFVGSRYGLGSCPGQVNVQNTLRGLLPPGLLLWLADAELVVCRGRGAWGGRRPSWISWW